VIGFRQGPGGPNLPAEADPADGQAPRGLLAQVRLPLQMGLSLSREMVATWTGWMAIVFGIVAAVDGRNVLRAALNGGVIGLSVAVWAGPVLASSVIVAILRHSPDSDGDRGLILKQVLIATALGGMLWAGSNAVATELRSLWNPSVATIRPERDFLIGATLAMVIVLLRSRDIPS
jgi:hypothetical protein